MTAPPYCNTGVYPHEPIPPRGASGSAFDWYRATVPAHPQLVLEALTEAVERDLGFEPTLHAGSPRWSFLRADMLCDRKGLRIAEVLHGGRNPNPSVESSGAMAPIVAGILRDRGTHYASRVDVAIDRAGPTLFREWRALCERLSMQYRLAMRVIEAPTDPDAGSTVYLGSRKSEVFLRVYEKGLKTAHDEGLAQIPDEYRHWVRAEIEFKPDKKAAKHAAALMEPDVFWGITEWLAHFALEAFAMRAEPVNLRERRLSDHDRAMRWMADQYRSHLDRLWRDHGRDDAAAFRALRELAGIGALSEAA